MGKRSVVVGCILAGVASGLVSMYVLPSQYEALLWLALVAGAGWAAHRIGPTGLFWRGFWSGLLMGICISLTHFTFLKDYVGSHMEEVAALQDLLNTPSRQLAVIVPAPLYWGLLAVLSGLSAVAWKRVRG